MRILSVTEHINTLNNVIDQQAELINDVERMRRLQILIKKDEPHLKLGNGTIQLQGELQAAEKLVDESLIKLKTGGENNAAKKNQNA